MGKQPTLKDVCREASVSPATVSRVINGSSLVHPVTRKRVEEVIEQLGYRPNTAARSLSRNQTELIGLVFHQISSGFYATVLEGIDEEARKQGYHILTAFSEEGKDCRELSLSLFEATRVDGLIVLASGLNDAALQRLKEYERPFVLIEQEVDDDDVNTVSCKNEEGAYLATRHLLDLGHRDILVLTGPTAAQDSQLREKGARRALAEAGIPAEQQHFLCANYSPQAAPDVFDAHCAEHGRPSALFAFNDAMALSVIKHLRGQQVRVPEDMAVVGFDGIDCAAYMGLTTVETPIAEMGRSAVRALLETIRTDPPTHQQIMLDVQLTIRESCGAPEVDAPAH
jgi:LacI family transcriptional regulator